MAWSERERKGEKRTTRVTVGHCECARYWGFIGSWEAVEKHQIVAAFVRIVSGGCTKVISLTVSWNFIIKFYKIFVSSRAMKPSSETRMEPYSHPQWARNACYCSLNIHGYTHKWPVFHFKLVILKVLIIFLLLLSFLLLLTATVSKNNRKLYNYYILSWITWIKYSQ